MNYTQEQRDEISERVKKAGAYLEELELGLSAQIAYHNNGNDNFVTKVVPYLQDLKYSKTNETTETISESLEA